jgi:hypothetical protein
LSYRLGLNITADFKGLGGFTARTDPGANTLPGQNRQYDDGYVQSDVRGLPNQTWNWGYYDRNTLSPGATAIDLNSSSSSASAMSPGVGGDPQHGFELTFGRQLGQSRGAGWGFELAFNFTDLTIHDATAVSTPVTRITDTYSFGGFAPPLSPYYGTFLGPGPSIGSAPTRVVGPGFSQASITGQRNLDAHVYGFKLGPYLETALAKPLKLTLGGGLALGMIESAFRFNETVRVQTAENKVENDYRTGSSARDGFLYGGYVGGRFDCAISRALSLFIGAEYQTLGRFSQSAGGQEVRLNLGNAVFTTVGLGFSF